MPVELCLQIRRALSCMEKAGLLGPQSRCGKTSGFFMPANFPATESLSGAGSRLLILLLFVYEKKGVENEKCVDISCICRVPMFFLCVFRKTAAC